MSEPEPLVLASETGAVARLALNRPRAGNSLSMGLVEALRAELARLEAPADQESDGVTDPVTLPLTDRGDGVAADQGGRAEAA